MDVQTKIRETRRAALAKRRNMTPAQHDAGATGRGNTPGLWQSVLFAG